MFGFSKLLIKSTENADLWNFIVFFLISLVCLSGYLILRFLGIGLIALGMISSTIVLNSISLFSGIVNNSFALSKIFLYGYNEG